MTCRVTESFQRMMQSFGLNKNDTLIVGVSGGIDSMCLLHLLIKEGYRPIVAHVNHNIRAESESDAAFVADYCEKYGCEYEVHSIKEIKNTGFEEKSRNIRYQFFNQLAKKHGAKGILLAHHANDSCETMIFHLIRGTGLKGLTGIPAQRENIYRPLINMTRNDIEEYCKKNAIEWREDQTNSDCTITRNQIRHEVIPELLKVSPQAIKNMLMTQEILKQGYSYLHSSAKKWLKHKPYSLSEFRKLDQGLQTEIIATLYKDENPNKHPLSHMHIEQIIKILMKGSTGNQKEFGPEKMIIINKDQFEIKKP